MYLADIIVLAIMVHRDLVPTLKVYNSLATASLTDGDTVEAMQYFSLATKSTDLIRINTNWIGRII